MRSWFIPLVLLVAACGSEAPKGVPEPSREAELAARLEELGANDAEEPERQRRLRAIALGQVGGAAARDELLAMLVEDTGDREADGPTHLYAVAGLTILGDPGTAIDLVLSMSYCNPDDNIAALASEERDEEYYTIDAQIGDALLSMGMWNVEEELVRQLRRRDRIRVLIDAYAVLRRQTGLDLPYRYNGSYADRIADADAWLAALRASRAERARKRPFDREDARFRKRCDEVVAWLGAPSVNYQLIAHKALSLIGSPALPSLLAGLESDNRVWQRQTALALGRLGDPEAIPALRAAVGYDDPDARAKALDALRLIGDAESAGLALPLLGHEDAGIRSATARYLGRFGDAKSAIGPLKEAHAAERAPGTRTALSCALHRLGDDAVRSELIGIFVNGEQLDRVAALEALLERAPIEPAPSALDPIEERRKVAQELRKR